MISNLPERIFLCGFMGAGKSAIGQRLANVLGCDYLDLDERMEENAGCTIPKIFEREGEAGFRTLERRTVLEVIRKFEGVVSLGGGSLHNQHMVDQIKLNGLLIFIETPVSVTLKRISEDENRPLLLDKQGKPKSKEILQNELRALYEERLPLYEQAVIKIENDGSEAVQEIVEQLLKKIRNHVEYY